MSRIAFEFPVALLIGAVFTVAVVVQIVRGYRRQSLPTCRIASLATLRLVALALITALVARPVSVEPEQAANARDSVVLLIDRSESMSLEDGGERRFTAAVRFVRDKLLPAIHTAGLRARAWLFAEDAILSDGNSIAHAEPIGRATNLARALMRCLAEVDPPPLAIVALTDGAANDQQDNSRAMAAVLANRVPVISLGFGSESGVRLLSIQHVTAPPTAAPKQTFAVSSRLESTGPGDMPGFELVLLRDGKYVDRKRVAPGKGNRTWLESFSVHEDNDGTHHYAVQLLPPTDPGLRCVTTQASATVRITDEKEIRVLFAQGALTWDYKFIRLALSSDPSIKLTGLSRTADNRFFYQDVERVGELSGGFPTTTEAMAPFHVVVLSSMRAGDLTAAQQDVLARYCGELGGGVLMIGGAATFDASWQKSRLEELLPVRFSPAPHVGGTQPFHLQLTDAAIEHRVFQVTDPGQNRQAWSKLPAFTSFAVVDDTKPGAQVWAVHPGSRGAAGPRPVMALQRYGAGHSGVLCVENLWRWRLAKESDPRHFDRFWQQLFRHLGAASREPITIRFADQELLPDAPVRVIIERQISAKAADAKVETCRVQFRRESESPLGEQTIELAPGKPVEISFRAGPPGNYTVSLTDARQASVASRTIDIKDVNIELQRATREMETLRQWAGLSGGVALRIEDCTDADDLIAQIQKRLQANQSSHPQPLPLGLNGWVFCALIGCLCGDWLVRKKWGMT